MVRHTGETDTAAPLLEVILDALPLDRERQLEWKDCWRSGCAADDERLRREQEQRYAERRGLLRKLIRRARPRGTAADLSTAVDLIAGAVDGLGIQAVLEPAAFTDARLRRAASAIVASVI